MNIAAVIPAFNEEVTIGPIVSTLRQVPEISEVIVVSDGSTDETAAAAAGAGARVLVLAENQGKAAAMYHGFTATGAAVVLFLDGDLIGLTPRHVMRLIEPVLGASADMTVGVFEDGRIATDLAQVVAPYLSGQRCLRRCLLEEMLLSQADTELRFGVEVALTRYVKRTGYRVLEVPLDEMTHRMKEEKFGLVKGFAARMRMYWDILKYVQRM